MGDQPNKKPALSDEEQEVTPAFRQQVRAMLENNEKRNHIRGTKEGERGHRPSTQAELARAYEGGDKNTIRRMIGSAKTGAGYDIAWSRHVAPIRKVLGLAEIVEISVPSDRAEVLRFVAGLTDAAFKAFEDEIRRLMQESLADPRNSGTH